MEVIRDDTREACGVDEAMARYREGWRGSDTGSYPRDSTCVE